MSQSHFSEDNSHFLLRFVKDRKLPVKKELGYKKTKFHIHRSGTKKGILSEKAGIVKEISESRKKIFKDDRFYFVIQFSSPINSWCRGWTSKNSNVLFYQ